MGITDKFKTIGSRLKLDSHHGIERFGVLFAVLMLLFTIVVGTSAFSARTNNAAQLDSTAVYTSRFTTSKTQLSGEVPGVYVSPDRTRAVVLMKFRDSALIPADASDYQAFLTGSTMDLGQEKLATSIKGQIVVFGSTGYLGVVLDSTDGPFAQQVMNVTLRSNSELVYTPGDPKIRSDLRDDGSFATYDQWRMYINPGASGAVEAESLSSASFDPGSFYAETVTALEEQKVRDKFEETLLKMRSDLAVIDEYEAQLGRVASTDGDFLVPVRGDDSQDALRPIAGDEITGDEATEESESTLELITDWVPDNGFDFDWRVGSVYEGYLDSIMPSGERYGTWLATKTQAPATTFNKNDISWVLSDGTSLEDALITRSASVMEPLTTLRTSLETAYATYAADKTTYQVTLPTQLLELEVVLRNVQASSSIGSADAVLIY